MPRTATRHAAAATVALTSGLLALGTAALAHAAPASAAASPVGGTVYLATENTWHHSLEVRGLVFDRTHPHRSLRLAVYAGGRLVRHVTANIANPQWNRTYHVPGRHKFRITVPVDGAVKRVSVVPVGHAATTLTRRVRHVTTPAGTRIVDVAKRYVGHARYVDGGATPKRGFDCSGYTRWVYAHARVRKNLPHNAESQRHVRGMRHITRRAARPGDLVFYFSGGPAYHVAIYAGHGMQYAAATPRDGIRHQKIWSRNVEFRTLRN